MEVYMLMFIIGITQTVGNLATRSLQKSTPASSTPTPSPALPKLTGRPDLTVTTPAGSRYGHVVALPGGGALVADHATNPYRVVRLNRRGQVVPPAFTCRTRERISGMVLDGHDVYVVQSGGTVTKTRVSSLNHTRAEWRVPGVGVVYPGALVGKELYLVDYSRKIAVSFNLESKHKTIRKTGLTHPLSIVTTTSESQRIFIIAEYYGHRISIFNARWDLISTIGQWGSGDGQLYHPSQVLVTPWSTLLVSDRWNHRVTEFSLSGRFLRHLLTSRDGLHYPTHISYSSPYLWVVDASPDVARYTPKRYQLVP